VRAAAFTGSTAAGRTLADIAAARPTPIPFYGELGSVNPVFVTEGALRENSAGIAEGYVASVSGPYPAATVDSTSVGTAAIGRFLRSVTYQNAPQSLLPPPLRDANPWNVPQRRSPNGLSAQWGSLSGQY
jgi:hypothetical protein